MRKKNANAYREENTLTKSLEKNTSSKTPYQNTEKNLDVFFFCTLL